MGHNVAGNDRTDSLLSRGTTIITQKENKGEYRGINCWAENSCAELNSDSDAWRWNNTSYDWDIYAHVVDQNGPKNGNEIPYQYSANTSEWIKSGSEYWSHPNIIPRCTTTTATGDSNTRTPEIDSLYSGTRIPSTSKACVANTHNAGNYYSFPAATAGSDTHLATSSDNIEVPNSICPKGWQLPSNSETKSYQRLIRDIYQITDDPSGSMDINLLNNPTMSFVRLGYYNYDYGSLASRGQDGTYWNSNAFSNIQGRHLRFASELFSPHQSANRAYGFSIRCVSR